MKPAPWVGCLLALLPLSLHPDAQLSTPAGIPVTPLKSSALSRASAGVDALLIAAVIQVESRGNPRAIGRRGELGLMQLGPHLTRRMHNPFDPVENQAVGTAYLRECLSAAGGDIHEALRRYNAGPSGRGFRSWAYANKVLSVYRQYKEEL